MTDPTAIPSFPPPPDEHPLRGRVLDALTDAGLAPNLDAEGDVSVEVERQKFFVRCADGQLPVMRLFGQWKIGGSVPSDELRRLKAANDLSARLNLVKVSVHGDVLLVTVDQVVPDGTSLRTLLTVAFSAVLAAVRTWHVEAGGTVDESGSAGDGGGS
jgi:hypothetical protein